MTKKSEDLVSVIVPIYKVEPYLERCLDSIIRQTYTNLEIILVDDGSPDGCGAICDRYKEKDSRIIVIHKENGGLSSARNAGLDICTGEYISFVDSDDYIEPDMIEVMVRAMIETGADISICGIFDEYLSKENSIRLSSKKKEIFSKEEIIKMQLTNKESFSVCNKVYRREIWIEVRFSEGQFYEDMDISSIVMSFAGSIVHVGKPLYHYVHREHSITTAINVKNIQDQCRAIRNVSVFVKEKYPLMREELVYFKNSRYLPILFLCYEYNYNGKEKKDAYSYLRKNWNNEYLMGKKGWKKRLIYLLIVLRLILPAYRIRRYFHFR